MQKNGVKNTSQKKSNKYNNVTAHGFTLIELLVVVLIIGILAAVALPQYQKAVEKSRFSQYATLANSLVSGIQVSYMANGEWTTSFDDLTVDLPADMSTENTINYGTICRKNNKIFCCIAFPTAGTLGCVVCGDNNYKLAALKMYADNNGTPRTNTGCIAKDEPYKSVCKSISGKNEATSTYLPTPNNWKSGYSSYLLD